MVVRGSKNFNNKCIGAAFSFLARGQCFSSFTVGIRTCESLLHTRV